MSGLRHLIYSILLQQSEQTHTVVMVQLVGKAFARKQSTTYLFRGKRVRKEDMKSIDLMMLTQRLSSSEIDEYKFG